MFVVRAGRIHTLLNIGKSWDREGILWNIRVLLMVREKLIIFLQDKLCMPGEFQKKIS
jgi:hypothetical protein